MCWGAAQSVPNQRLKRSARRPGRARPASSPSWMARSATWPPAPAHQTPPLCVGHAWCGTPCASCQQSVLSHKVATTATRHAPLTRAHKRRRASNWRHSPTQSTQPPIHTHARPPTHAPTQYTASLARLNLDTTMMSWFSSSRSTVSPPSSAETTAARLPRWSPRMTLTRSSGSHCALTIIRSW